jgi:hypothetical protein
MSRLWKPGTLALLILALLLCSVASVWAEQKEAATFPAAQFQQVKTYSWTLEAYKDGRLVASTPFTNTATSDQQAREFVNNKLACWGQDLDARGLKWDMLNAAFLYKN